MGHACLGTGHTCVPALTGNREGPRAAWRTHLWHLAPAANVWYEHELELPEWLPFLQQLEAGMHTPPCGPRGVRLEMIRTGRIGEACGTTAREPGHAHARVQGAGHELRHCSNQTALPMHACCPLTDETCERRSLVRPPCMGAPNSISGGAHDRLFSNSVVADCMCPTVSTSSKPCSRWLLCVHQYPQHTQRESASLQSASRRSTVRSKPSIY